MDAVTTHESTRAALGSCEYARIAECVNGFALSHALFTFAHSRLLETLRADGEIAVRRAAEQHGYDVEMAIGLLRYLATQGLLVEANDHVFYASPRGDAAFSTASVALITFFVGGYGPLMRDAGKLLDGSLKYGRDVTRSSRFVALGSSISTSEIIDDVPRTVLQMLGVKTIADLGCGAGRFMVSFLQQSPEHRAIGVDISEEAIAEAAAACEAAGVGDRASFWRGDGFDLDFLRSRCSEVDAFYSFAMEHECLRAGEDAVIQHIDGMAERFPGKRYLLGEPRLLMSELGGPFYWLHMLSEQGLPRDVPGWCSLLSKLTRAKLEHVYVPDHRSWGMYYNIQL